MTKPRWQTLIVVCRQCSKRSSGPRKLKGKQVVRALQRSVPGGKRLVRVVGSTCLGLCPKRCVAVAVHADRDALALCSIRSVIEAEALASQLAGPIDALSAAALSARGQTHRTPPKPAA